MIQSNIILRVLKDSPNQWFYSHQLVKTSTKYGWLGTSSTRRCRELAEEGRIEANHDEKEVRYRYKAPSHRIVYEIDKERGLAVRKEYVR